MIGDHHGRTAARASLLVRAMDDILGTHMPGRLHSVVAGQSAITAPVMVVRGEESKFVADEDVAQFRSRMPGLRAEVVPEAGHAIQSDQPLALAHLIEEFVFG
jgi:pimeloyl-ACP methyl ester carboxylesterase